MFLSTLGFFNTFATTRIVTHAIRDGRRPGPSRAASQVTSVLHGAGAALTLDEFALWLNLEDAYWTTHGRESIDAVALFGSALLLRGRTQ